MKAISTFIAAIMLVAFTVAAGVLLSTWFTTFTTKSTAGVGGQTQAATACSGAIDIAYAGKGKVLVVLTKSDIDYINLTSIMDSTGSISSVSEQLNNSVKNVTLSFGISSGATWVKVSGTCYVAGQSAPVEASCYQGQTCWAE